MVARPRRPDQLTLRELYLLELQSGHLDAQWKKRWQKSEEYAGWLSEAMLPTLSMDQANSLYRASGGTHHKDFTTNSIDDIKDSLDFLLYDTIKLESRFDECVSSEGAYHLVGASKGFISYLLCLREPSLFGFWNNHAERSLRVLGLYPKTLSKGHWGLRYIDLLDALQVVRVQMGLGNFREVDQFASWLAKSGPRLAK